MAPSSYAGVSCGSFPLSAAPRSASMSLDVSGLLSTCLLVRAHTCTCTEGPWL